MPVSRERFEQGMTYGAYREQMTRNRERPSPATPARAPGNVLGLRASGVPSSWTPWT